MGYFETMREESGHFAIVPDRVERDLRSRLSRHPANRLFGFELEIVKLDYCRMAAPYREEITNGPKSRGTVHGGVLAALADTAAAFALSTCFDGHMSFATVDLHITYLARAQSRLLAHARVIRKGSRINVCDVDITDEKDRLVAKAVVNFILTKPLEPK